MARELKYRPVDMDISSLERELASEHDGVPQADADDLEDDADDPDADGYASARR